MTDTYAPARPAAPLNNDILNEAPALVAVPTYDRSALTPGVVHIGVGGFHRAHQAAYFNELAEQGVSDWGIVGVGLHSRGIKEALEPQDLLYTLVERGAGDDHAQVVGAHAHYLYAPDDPERIYAALADPAIRLVTLTVTGDGYHVDQESLEFRADADEVVADLEGPDCCATFAAFIVEGLRRRRGAGEAPFTVLSCDNVPRNGQVARAAVAGFARLRDPELADWIEAHVAFPSSMVDRITPETDDAVAEMVERDHRIEDNAPVTTEPFRQWIIEDDFCNGRPPLDLVGAQFVADVAPYELMKKRMLNGTHSALGYLGHLAGCRTTDEVMEDEVLGAFVARLVTDEIVPLVPSVPGIDLAEYTETLLERLSNPKIGDELTRLCRRGSTKVPSYLLPSVAEAFADDRPRELLTLAVAGWVRYLRCADDIQDARLDELRPLAADARRFATDRSVFGELSEDAGFAEALAAAVQRLEADGPCGAIRRALS
ncbi:MAG: mannitol 2-dehydrogenase [Solirubrobacteraceae bacterium]|nr:mannitol 2-dehydrogenase [Solirubrobacteraceae bacterium]